MSGSGDLKSLQDLEICPLCPAHLPTYHWTSTNLAIHIRSKHQSQNHDPTLSAEQLTLLYTRGVRDCPHCHRCYSLTRSYDSHVRVCVDNNVSPVAGKKRKSNDNNDDDDEDQMVMSQINPSMTSVKRQRLADQVKDMPSSASHEQDTIPSPLPQPDLSSSDSSESTIPPSWLTTHNDDHPASSDSDDSTIPPSWLIEHTEAEH